MFRYLLVLPDDAPNDPTTFVTVVLNWSVGDDHAPRSEQLRILGIETQIADLLVDNGFTGVFVVQPLAIPSATMMSPSVLPNGPARRRTA